MNNNVHLGDGVPDKVVIEINKWLNRWVETNISKFLDSFEDKAKGFFETNKQPCHSPEIEQKIAALWSEYLFEEGFVPGSYKDLPDNLLISNFHQEGYLDGLYAGYILAMMALADNDVPKDIILAARNYIRPNLIGHNYDNRDEFICKYKDEKYSWIDKIKEL